MLATDSPPPKTHQPRARRRPANRSLPPTTRNCDAVRAADDAPLFEGEPGYRPELDRDGDGIACE
ncbi:excalibur calcium-binding domain-containing protein [Micromonospora wenchangensis]|uniref:excalibur calcium-binding domain-containing protein n=1 Tax=Micromonospora wenchangensis TaxID=1185415 RepID=UPI003825D902